MHVNASPTLVTVTPTPRATTPTPRATKHAATTLSHARQDIDLSGRAPGERCKYPSKFCGHKRARKTTGKLHRFCEYHRTRARLNQKRWADGRRRQDRSDDRDRAIADSTRLLGSIVEWSAAMDADHTHLITDNIHHHHHQQHPLPLWNPSSMPMPTTPPTKEHHQRQYPNHDSHNAVSLLPSSPTAVDATHQYQSSSVPLSDDEIEQLMTLLVDDPLLTGIVQCEIDPSVGGVFNEESWPSAM